MSLRTVELASEFSNPVEAVKQTILSAPSASLAGSPRESSSDGGLGSRLSRRFPRRYGRGAGVGRRRGTGVGLGVAVAGGVVVAVGVGVGPQVPRRKS
jgi:hypothetical protein